MGRTSRLTPLLTVKVHIAGEEVTAIVDSGASVLVIEKRLAWKVGIWKRANKVKVKQEDGSNLEGNFMVNTSVILRDSSLVLGKVSMDAEV